RIGSLGWRHNGFWKDLGFPAQTVIQSEVRLHLPLVLGEECEVFILYSRLTWRRSARNSSGNSVLQIQQQWAAYVAARRTRLIKWSALCHPSGERAGRAKAFAHSRSKTSCSGRRGVAQ